jgi:trans-2,3-dihydro-3-hydroxyanthranilate isomerase
VKLALKRSSDQRGKKQNSYNLNRSRRRFVAAASAAAGTAMLWPSQLLGNALLLGARSQSRSDSQRIFRYAQMDVFTSKRLEGNPLSVFTDARGLTDSEMQDLARETNLQETTFVFPRDPEVERQEGVKVRIFVPGEEIPFGGHPTLGTAMVLRNLRVGSQGSVPSKKASEIVLDLKVGKVPVVFHEEPDGRVFGEMHQVDPEFGPLHNRETVAALLDLNPSEIAEEWPIQTISTGLPFAIVLIKKLSTFQSLHLDLSKVYKYLDRQNPKCDFYYVCRDTQDREVGLRARCILPIGEDPATGSAAGCTAAWMVRYGIAQPEEIVHIEQGVEMKRPSHLFVRVAKAGDRITNVRVGGHAVQIMQGELFL